MTIIGIAANQGNHYYITHNEIDRLPNISTRGSIGINMVQCEASSSVSFNSVLGYVKPEDAFTTPASIGYRFFNTSPTAFRSNSTAPSFFKVCSNYVRHCKDGFKFIGKNGVVFAENAMFENMKSLRLTKDNSSSSFIGVQFEIPDFHKNIWQSGGIPGNTSTGDNGAILDDPNGNPNLSKFIVKTRASTTCGTNLSCNNVASEKVSVPLAFTKEDWFGNGGVNDLGCGTGNVAAIWEPLDDAILNNEFDQNNEVTLWEARRYLFQKLSDYPELLNADGARQAFYNQYEQTNIPIFNQIKIDINSLFDLNPTHQAQMDLLTNQEKNAIAQWVAFAAEKNIEFGNNPWSDEAVATFNLLSETLAVKQLDIANLEAEITASINQKLQQLKLQNQSISAQHPFENDAKSANHYWLRHVETKGHLTANELETVRLLAAQCFYTVGSAKYQAMDILPLRETENYWGTGCGTPSGRIVKTNVSHALRFSPNPAADVLRFDAENWEKVTIFDLAGRIVANLQQTAENTNTIDVSYWLNGIYILHVTHSDGTTQASKISVLH